MASAVLVPDLESYVGLYGTHGAIQRLQFIAQTSERKALKVDANRLCFDLLKRTQNTKGYVEVFGTLKELLEADEATPPHFDTGWVEATNKQASILKDVYEQDLHQAKSSQLKDQIRVCHTQLANFCTEQGDYAQALKNVCRSREIGCSDPRSVFTTCMSIIKLNVLLRQYPDIQSFASKAQHTPFKEDFASDASKVAAAFGLYYMTASKYKDAATSFSQVKPQDLDQPFADVICAQDVVVYGTLCALASWERNQVQKNLLDSSTFRECFDLAPALRDLATDFCNCRYASCLAALAKLREGLELDVHLNGHVADLLQQIRSRGMVQYFAPFLSVSLYSMAEAFNTDVDGIQAEVAQLVGKRQLDAKIDSHKKILHVRYSDQRKATYQNAMRVSQEFLDTTKTLILRMNLLKRDFGVNLARQKKWEIDAGKGVPVPDVENELEEVAA